MIDRLLEIQNLIEWLVLLFFFLFGPFLGGFFLGRALSVRSAMATFGIGTAILAFLAYRAYQSEVEYCKDSFEVADGGDPLSCLEPGNWFAFNLELLVLLLAQLGLVTVLAASVIYWLRKRRLPLPGTPSSAPSR